MTHNMIRNLLCHPHRVGNIENELCTLRIYCKETRDEGGDGHPVHSETTRNEIADRLQDEEFFNYVSRIGRIGLGAEYQTGQVLNDLVCLAACTESRTGCE